MGVPSFVKWLTEKYRKVMKNMVESKNSDPIGKNPNGEYDNLYVDMNGLIHPCSHPQDRPAPATELEMYVNVGKYIDRLFAVIRPRRLVYFAIDGVAPRAKMNQQRIRRFRAARDAKEQEAARISAESWIRSKGIEPPPNSHKAWDSNVITPGTDFMHHLSGFIRQYIQNKILREDAWKPLKVIFSDASVPGEGEHKIINFIRYQVHPCICNL